MKIRNVDFETTDTDKAKKDGKPVGICEFGYTDFIIGAGVARPVSSLVNCGIPITPAARGVHHISDADVAGAMPPDQAMARLMDGMEPGDMFAAHNAAFERMFFGGGSFPWICTLICAKHLYEDAPDHKNQTLRYYLNIDPALEWPELSMPPHRAGPDSYVSAHILAVMAETADPIRLLELTSTPVIQKLVQFSKHAGERWEDMDNGFLQWCLDKDFVHPDAKTAAKHWLDKRRAQDNPFK